MQLKHLIVALCTAASAPVFAQTYTIEPNHTFPSVETDHFGGLSVWRGKFNKTSGTIVLDRPGKTGTVDITIDTTSVDFGHAKFNEHLKSDDILNVAKFPTATYKSKSINYNGDTPASIDGEFTLAGVTRPLTLTINKFKCMMHPMMKREVCGADASGTFNRGDFGVNYGLPRFLPEVKLAIQVEALKAN